MEPIRYFSTQRGEPGGQHETIGFRDALFAGLAPDGGLYMPDRLPSLDPALLGREAAALTYAETAYRVLRPFVEGTLDLHRFRALCEDAYDFDVPVERIGDRWMMFLDRGPTASFKDFAARLMARLMAALRPAGRPLTVLTATSGDTGGAVGHAFLGLPGVQVFLLYPEREVSLVQKKQMDALGGNVHTLAIRGTFDQCQALAKQAFLDRDLAALNLTSANSINIGRILPQSVYYVYAAARVAPGGGPVSFAVPSGNFGNSFGAEVARRMGLPVRTLVLAVNANDEFPRFLDEGRYAPVTPSRACLSNAMNVGNPSNLARYFEAYGGTITREGAVRAEPDLAAMRAHLASVSISDEATVRCMRQVHADHGLILDPHGAVGWAALDRLRARIPDPVVCLETAHPAKFPEIVAEALGVAPPVPPSLAAIGQAPAAPLLEADYTALKEALKPYANR